MSETYPQDANLLALTQDTETGVEYIPTGQSPYFLAFRRMLQRLLLASSRANDLRVYQSGALTIGVRPGRCYIGGAARFVAGIESIVIGAGVTTHVWLDDSGVVQNGTGGLPTDRTGFIPLAEVVTGVSTILTVTDLRGEAFLQIPDVATLGLTATVAEINQALAGIVATVDADALNRLTTGPLSTADSEHRHLQARQTLNGETFFTLINDDPGASANTALVFSLPNLLADDTVLLTNTANGFLQQRFNGTTYHLVGSVHAQFSHEGQLTTNQSGKLLGAVQADGVVSGVFLSLGANIESDTGADGVTATVYVNGVAVTSTDPGITDADGAGFRSTVQGDGTAGVVKSDGTEVVQRGDVLTVDLTRSVAGTVTAEATDVVVMIVIRPGGPE